MFCNLTQYVNLLYLFQVQEFCVLERSESKYPPLVFTCILVNIFYTGPFSFYNFIYMVKT